MTKGKLQKTNTKDTPESKDFKPLRIPESEAVTDKIAQEMVDALNK